MSLIKDSKGSVLGGIELQAALGGLSGIKTINKFGYNFDLDTGVEEDIHDLGGIWVPPTQARVHNVLSSDIADTGTITSSGTTTEASVSKLVDSTATFQTDSVAVNDLVLDDTGVNYGYVTAIISETELTIYTGNGIKFEINSGDSYRIITPGSTGAAVVKIDNGLDSSFNEISEFVVLNGTTNVPTLTEYIMISRMFVLSAGSGDTNTGNISAVAVTDSTTTNRIKASEGQTAMAIYQVPANKKLIISEVSAGLMASASARQIEVRFRVRELGGVYRTVHFLGLQSTGTSSVIHEFKPTLLIPEKAVIKLSATSGANNSGVEAAFSGYLFDNPLPIEI